ncbi:type II toxin-antitoxin system RelE/ParE family toxin [Leptospira bandrabouensis]|uniref:type II toxin-antitoxin system RelE/ParE family toxin n=1 Tax=Leptospira bandrabouensis TaxID=2484903 RepID=UPI00223E7584|nr:type II toxin-antitoxin system RelE/ParE family toxin [Leptospira bandrabouensis]MCW7460427.1 type II toxin-antitoxin system RelE/ParE family toxin [Leptospira bandrabouensis]MCW7479372.1 type II toxin-antitoxin system RelE/ParE family toxin [Leptospira bandrabouensis]MCW7487048.1 type II toxin-antitoxin system RelE/ParE family toxin [Leptospira bandrabouensis]
MKVYPVRVKPTAQSDITNAVNFYEAKVPGLGNKLLAEIDRSIKRIEVQPLIGIVIYKNFHQILTKKFPFRIIYTFKNEELNIYAFFHQSREFQRLVKRIKT